jgi:hypothetical protein
MNNQVICCFCSEALDENIASIINIRIIADQDEWQNLFAHNNCILIRVNKNIPIAISRILSWYDNETEKLVNEIELDIELLQLQKIIGQDNFQEDIFLHKIYDLTEPQVKEILKIVNSQNEIDTKKYSYVLEAYTQTSHNTR